MRRSWAFALFGVPCMLAYVYVSSRTPEVLRGAPPSTPLAPHQLFPPPLKLVPRLGAAAVPPVSPSAPQPVSVPAPPAPSLLPVAALPPVVALPIPDSSPATVCALSPLQSSFVAQCALGSSKEFKAAVAAAAGPACDLVVTLGNQGFLDMIENFLATSVLHWAIPNVLVVALSDGVCDRLPSGVHCFQYPQSFADAKYGSPEFAALVHIKTEVALTVLQLGYSVLLVDGDIIFLQNPLPAFRRDAGAYDVQIQDDDAEGSRNSGFMYIKAGNPGATFLLKSLVIGKTTKNMRQQPAVNQALKEMGSQLSVKVCVCVCA